MNTYYYSWTKLSITYIIILFELPNTSTEGTMNKEMYQIAMCSQIEFTRFKIYERADIK